MDWFLNDLLQSKWSYIPLLWMSHDHRTHIRNYNMEQKKSMVDIMFLNHSKLTVPLSNTLTLEVVLSLTSSSAMSRFLHNMYNNYSKTSIYLNWWQCAGDLHIIISQPHSKYTQGTHYGPGRQALVPFSELSKQCREDCFSKITQLAVPVFTYTCLTWNILLSSTQIRKGSATYITDAQLWFQFLRPHSIVCKYLL